MYDYYQGQRVSCVHMKILWEPFSFHQLSIPFVCPSTTRPKSHRYVIAIALFALLFAQCFSNELTTDNKDDSDSVDATHKKWLNDDNTETAPAAFDDAKVAISKRQSPTKIFNSSSSGRTTRSFGSTDISTPHGYQNLALFTLNGGTGRRTTFSPLSLTNFETMHDKQSPQSPSRPPPPPPSNNVLILIQTKKTIQLNTVRDQFQQFTDMFGVQLRNISIDFDVIDGK